MATNFSTLSSPSRKGALATNGAPRIAAAGAGEIGSLPHDEPDPQAPPPRRMRLEEGAAPAAGDMRQADPSSPWEPPESPFARRARLAREQADSGARDYTYRGIGPLAATVREEDRAVVGNARRDIHATKVVARLVAAIARKPGSGVPNAVKSHHLAGLLKSVRDASLRLAAFVAPNDANRGWVQAAATESALTLVASQWERDAHEEVRPVEAQLDAIEDVFRMARDDETLAGVIDDLGQARYTQAVTAEIAQARVLLSARLAAWDLYSSVMHPLLGQGTFRYTYGKTSGEVVGRLMPELYAIARDNVIRTDSLDLRTSHMQGSLRRLSDLLGAEYVTRTRAIMNWIAEDGLPEAQYRDRFDRAKEQFEARVVPELIDWTRRNFVAVESMALRLMEEPKHEHEHVQRPAQ